MKSQAPIAITTFVVLALASTAMGQITANSGDGVLHAPYYGTIESLRNLAPDCGYGEVMSSTEPRQDPSNQITSATLEIHSEEAWDRSVLRLYQGLDASGSEVDLTSPSPVSVPKGSNIFTRFSFKAIGIKTLTPKVFHVHFQYTVNGSTAVDAVRVVTVAPMTGSFGELPGLSEAFHFGTPILDVSAGNARLRVPIGRTAEMIGATFIINQTTIGPTGTPPLNSSIPTTDCLLPGAAETVFLQPSGQFSTGGSSTGPLKLKYGTPWTGYLRGYRTDTLIRVPDGTRFDSLTPNQLGMSLRRIDYINPLGLPQNSLASTRYLYDDSTNNRVVEIADNASPSHRIILQRTAGVVDHIYVRSGSDPANLRGWAIQSHPVTGLITGVIPDSGKGARYFSYNSARRCTDVRDADNNVMYEFVFDAGDPTILTAERRFVDGGMQTAVEHVVVSSSLQRRKENAASGEFRQIDYNYDTPNGYNHRLASITTYSGLNGGGTPFTTTFTHDVNNASGSVFVTQVTLPDASTLTHEYDRPLAPGNPDIHFGFRTKTTRAQGGNSLVLYDVEYEFLYEFGVGMRLFHRPRIVKQRDGRGVISEVTFDYENGDENQAGDPLNGEISNLLLSRQGPPIDLGPTDARTSQTHYTYSSSQNRLISEVTNTGASTTVEIAYAYDSMLRMTSRTVDPGVGHFNITTQYQYFDNLANPERIIIDADNYYTKTILDPDGREMSMRRYLAAGGATGNFYGATNTYDVNGRLSLLIVDNKDQSGADLTPTTIATEFNHDRLGRLTLSKVDPAGIGAESNMDYNWLGDIEREFDTSGRGVKRTFDGRGLVASEIPLAQGATPDVNLTTTYSYDALGNRRFANLPTGAILETVYDDFSRVSQQKRTPGPDGGNVITTTYTYDNASNVTRTRVDEAAVWLSDVTAQFDEGGFNYESRRRLSVGTDGGDDPVTQRKFDWAGNVTEERMLGDTFTGDRFITTRYDTANRVDRVTDSTSGQTDCTRDDRGNVLTQALKLDGMTNAVTASICDALGRAVQIADPEGNDRIRAYDSRGNLLAETLRDVGDTPKMTSVFAYDNAGRLKRSLVQSTASPIITDVLGASATANRVVDMQYDADGRPTDRTVYNNNSNTPRTTTTTYDDLGRINRITDPTGSFTDDDYAANGRMSQRTINDSGGGGSFDRVFTFDLYDGHDRILRQIAQGTPVILTTMFTYDGLDRQTTITDPRGLTTLTSYDLAGRQVSLKEDSGGALERQTDFAYDRHGNLVTRTAKNKAFDGTTLADQFTRYRYDTLGRMIRTVYPDNTTDVTEIAITNCIDCMKMQYDAGGRMTSSTDQRALVTTMTYDRRSLLLTRTTTETPPDGVLDPMDTFNYDALGRLSLADRGTTVSQTATSHGVYGYSDLGDLTSEKLQIAGGTLRETTNAYDQAGNRLTLTYPSGALVGSTPMAINQVGAMSLNNHPFTTYSYASNGRVLEKRDVNMDEAGSLVSQCLYGRDTHRRISDVANVIQPSFGPIACFSYERDENGNLLTQTAHGVPPFGTDDRTFTVDRLNRFTDTQFTVLGGTESAVLDRVGNRKSHVPRTGPTTEYQLGNAANEYSTIDPDGTGGNPPLSVLYDPAGNLSQDEAGRHYYYDDHDRLVQIKASNDTTVLANYTYDALGRRIVFEDPITAVTTRYYYDGASVIEERDGADVRKLYHVHGGQYVDEHLATYTDAGQGYFYLTQDLHTVAGLLDANGSLVEAYDYTAYGWAGDPNGGCRPADLDGDGVVDAADLPQFITVLTDGTVDPREFCAADVNGDFAVNGADVLTFLSCLLNANCPPVRTRHSPVHTPYTMHGSPVDLLDPDGQGRPQLLLQYNRARYYDIKHGRWLQRDPLGYVNGNDLYEGFGGNPMSLTDPSGRGFWTWLVGLGWTPERPEMEQAARGEFVRDVGGRTLWLVSDVNNTDDLSQAQIYSKLGDEFRSMAGSVQLTNAAFNPSGRILLYYQNPQLAAQLTPEEHFNLVARGPAQGVLNAANGVQDIGVDLLNLGIQTNVPVIIWRVSGGDANSLMISSLDWSRALSLSESDFSHRASKFLGGQATVYLLTAGIGGAGSAAEGAEALVARFPAVSATGEVNLLNVARRGVGLTANEATAGLRFAEADAAPRATEYFMQRIVGDTLKYGRLRGRLGNIDTRLATLNELTALEQRNLLPQTEFFISAAQTGAGRVFPDIGVLPFGGVRPVEFVQFTRMRNLSAELARVPLIHRAYPGVPVRFVIVGK